MFLIPVGFLVAKIPWIRKAIQKSFTSFRAPDELICRALAASAMARIAQG